MRRTKAAMLQLKERAINLIKANPTLPMSRVALHVGVSQLTVAKWFKQEGIAKWFA